jgi:hypothetical protein
MRRRRAGSLLSRCGHSHDAHGCRAPIINTRKSPEVLSRNGPSWVIRGPLRLLSKVALEASRIRTGKTVEGVSSSSSSASGKALTSPSTNDARVRTSFSFSLKPVSATHYRLFHLKLLRLSHSL